MLDFLRLKDPSVVFLQETHSNFDNEADWGLWWKGERVLSHGTNISAGVAVLFSPNVNLKFLKKNELEPGRLMAVRAEINNFSFLFINIYAPNTGADRLQLFVKLEQFLKLQQTGDFIILGGDWNCTLDFTQDRNGDEPHMQSSSCLTRVIKSFNLADVWRENNPLIKQYTWVKISNDRIFGARLDRFYTSQNMRNRVFNAAIFPASFSDHKYITVDCVLVNRTHTSYYWHFNNKLLEDKCFCENFKSFWETWKSEKCLYESITQWWEIGKVHIKTYCQQYKGFSSLVLKNTVELLEKEILDIEKSMFVNDAEQLHELWTEKKNQLSSILNEKVKGALVRSRFLNIKDMDGPTSFFFNLERKAGQEKQMYCLKDNDGQETSDPVTMRRLAVDFYSDLFAAEAIDEQSKDELLQDLPVLTSKQKKLLETDLTFEEVTAAVKGLSSGKVPGLDGLSAEFYKKFWSLIGPDYFDVLKKCIGEKSLPLSCQRAVLTLLPKKGDLTLLKNWRPIAILCFEYKVLSKCLANRLNNVMHAIIHKDQSYCVKERCILDNLHLVRDIFDFAFNNNINLGFLSLDQEKAFDRVDHAFLFETFKAFGFGDKFISMIRLLYNDATCMIKIAGGLSVPVKVNRGIRQGCPLSGQLYSIVIEPLLCKFRRQLTGLRVNELEVQEPI